jgi:hypothetical protein
MNEKPNNIPKDNKKNKPKSGGASNIFRVPKKQVVVSPIKQKVVSDEKNFKRLNEIKKQKAKEEKQRLRQEKQKAKEELRKQQLQVKTSSKKAKKSKTEKKEEKQKRKKAREEKKEKSKIKNYNLDNLTALENIVLRRVEDREEKKRRGIILLLIVFLIILISVGSCTAMEIIDEHKPEPIEVDIIVNAEGLEKELIDPDDPESGFVEIILYPGDIIEVNFSVFNLGITKNFPVFVRFRAYIELEDGSPYYVFISTFKNSEMWYKQDITSIDGMQIDEWFYYGDLLQTGSENEVQILEALKLKEDLGNEYQGKNFTLVLEVEVVEGNVEAIDYFEEWWLAPEEWLELMGITIDDLEYDLSE